MSHSFSSAKSTFGTLKQNTYQSDYINHLKRKNIFCNNQKICDRQKILNNLDNCNILSTNKYNLIVGQYTKSNMKNVCVVSLGSPPTQYCSNENPCNPCQTTDAVPIIVSIDTLPFYMANTIDPLGELFGRTQCGELNYNKYMTNIS